MYYKWQLNFDLFFLLFVLVRDFEWWLFNFILFKSKRNILLATQPTHLYYPAHKCKSICFLTIVKTTNKQIMYSYQHGTIFIGGHRQFARDRSSSVIVVVDVLAEAVNNFLYQQINLSINCFVLLSSLRCCHHTSKGNIIIVVEQESSSMLCSAVLLPQPQ